MRTAAAQQPSTFACTACGSEQVRKLSAIWREGAATIKTTTRGSSAGCGLGCLSVLAIPFTFGLSLIFAVLGAGLGMGGKSKTVGSQQSLASLGASPPAKRKYVGPLLLGGLSVVTGGWVGMLLVAGGAAWGWSVLQHNRNVFPEEHRRWEHSYRCQRCEHVYVLLA
jgi:hypothetical protein